MVGAGLLAKKAVEKGLTTKPWVKTTLAPGSKVVTDYYDRAGLTPYLDKLGFQTVGYGCTTCIGNSGPLPEEVSAAIDEGDLVVVSVLSGNRNFEGRINPDVKMNYLASPPLVVAYALAGSMDVDITTEPLGTDADGDPVFLGDIWPTRAGGRPGRRRGHHQRDVRRVVRRRVRRHRPVEGDPGACAATPSPGTPSRPTSAGPRTSRACSREPAPITDIHGAKVLAMLGDSITTDHISPGRQHPQGLPRRRVPAGARRHAARLQQLRLPPRQPRGHDPRHVRQHPPAQPARPGHRGRLHACKDGEQTTIYEASQAYQAEGTPLVVLAGKEYGSGSSRDWAAKGTALLGVRAVIAETYERIHRSQPGRDGRAAAAVQRRRERRVAGPDRLGDLHHRGHRRRSTVPRELTVRADETDLHGHRPHRHARRAELLRARRDHAVRAAFAAPGLTAPTARSPHLGDRAVGPPPRQGETPDDSRRRCAAERSSSDTGHVPVCSWERSCPCPPLTGAVSHGDVLASRGGTAEPLTAATPTGTSLLTKDTQ